MSLFAAIRRDNRKGADRFRNRKELLPVEFSMRNKKKKKNHAKPTRFLLGNPGKTNKDKNDSYRRFTHNWYGVDTKTLFYSLDEILLPLRYFQMSRRPTKRSFTVLLLLLRGAVDISGRTRDDENSPCVSSAGKKKIIKPDW